MSYQEPSDLFSRPLVPYDNRCHRNGQAYPNLLAQALRAQQFIFVACSGAITDNIGATDGGSHVSPAAQHPQSPANVAGAHTQLTDVLDFRAQRLGDRDPDVMTVGIGGNDGQFSELVQHCARPWVSDCEDGTYWADGAVSQIDGDVFNRLVDTYTTLRDRFPGSTLLVFGYPTVIEPGASCGVSTAGLDGNETRFLGGTILTTLNQAVADAAAQAGAYYVDISRVTQGHDVCSDDPWINGLRLGLDGVEAESFHPNVTAHQRIAQYVVDHYTDGQGNLLVANPEPSEPIRPAVGHSMHLATLRGYVQQSCGAQCIQPAACVLTCQLQVQGDGYAPGSQLNMVLHSTPAELGSVMADAQGRIDTVVTIPPGTEAGLHWLAVDGSAPDGTDQEGTLGVNVFATAPPPTRVRPAVAAPVPVPPAAAATPSASRPIAPPKRKKVGVKVRVTRRGTTARIRLTCPRSAPSSCKVAALLKIKRPTKRHRTHLVTLVTKRVTIKPGRTVTLVLRRATIQRARRRLRLTVTTTTSVGTLRTTFRIPR
jgi:lysophospholipase L1-like esterase